MVNLFLKKLLDILLNLRGLCFLMIAFLLFYWTVFQISWAFSELEGYPIDTRVANVLFVISILLGFISAIIGTWGVFETLRRAHRLSMIAALIGLIIMGAYIVTVFVLFRVIKDDSEGLFLWLASTVLAYWLVTSMIGLAILLSNLFPVSMRICGLMLILGIPLQCALSSILGPAFNKISNFVIQTEIIYGPLFIMNILGFGGTGIGFLSSRFKIKPAVSNTVSE
jgi:hypothetical protein